MLVMYKNRFGSIELLGGAFLAKKEEQYHEYALRAILDLTGVLAEQLTCVRTDGCYALNNAALAVFGPEKVRRYVCILLRQKLTSIRIQVYVSLSDDRR